MLVTTSHTSVLTYKLNSQNIPNSQETYPPQNVSNSQKTYPNIYAGLACYLCTYVQSFPYYSISSVIIITDDDGVS